MKQDIEKALFAAAIAYHVLFTHFEDLGALLNLRLIYNYLQRDFLLPQTLELDILDLDSNESKRTKIRKLVTNMPKCGKPDYFKLLIKNLRESANEEEGDTAHIELADTLEQAYQIALKQPHAEKSRMVAQYKAEILNEKSAYVKQCFGKHWVICYTAVIAGLFLFGILPLILLSSLPRIDNTPLHRPAIVYGQQTLQIDFDQKLFQTLTAELKIDKCNGSAIVVDGANCDTLQEYTTESVYCDPFQKRIFSTYIYLLPGSLINIYIPGSVDFQNLEIWIYTTATSFFINKSTTSTDCNSPPKDAICYRANNHSGQNITYKVQTAEYYSIIQKRVTVFTLTPPRWDYTIKRYNLSEILAIYRHHETQLTAGQRSLVPLTKRFHFEKRKCLLLRSLCDSNPHNITVTMTTGRRHEFLVFPGAIVVIVTVVLAVVAFVHIVCFAREYKGRHRIGDVGSSHL